MFMKFKKTLILIFFFLLFISQKNYAFENKILFKVNNEVITSVDILNEIDYLNLINQNIKNLEKKEIFEISKNSLIKEKIKFIEISKYFDNFNIEKKYYDLLMNDFLKKINLNSIKQLKNYLNNKNISYETVEKKIKTEFFWNQLILGKFSKDVKIDKEKIRNQISKNKYQKEYLISEILFNLEKNEKLNLKFKKIKEVIETSGFEKAVLLYSISSSASNNGNVGWIKENSLSQKIKQELLNVELGKISKPIVIPGGFLVLKIEDVRKTKIEIDIDKELEFITNQIANKQLNQFSNIYLNKLKKEIQINEL